MPLASSSLAIVRAIKEAVFGVTPVAGNPDTLRVIGESLDFAISKETSQEINNSRGSSSMIPVGASASGGISAELSYQDHDDLIESTLQGTWAAMGTNGVTTSITMAFTATTMTASVAPTGSSALTLLQPGQWFRVQSAGANSGKILRVHPITAPTTTVITLDASTPAIVSASEACTLQSSRLTHGTTQTSFTLERQNSDIGVFLSYLGMTPSKMSVSCASGSRSQITFDFMGKSAMEFATTSLPGSPVAYSAYDIHSGVSGATNAVWMDGVPVTGTYVKSVTLNFDNSLRVQDALGTLGAVGIGSGTIQCSLSVQVYFQSKDLFTKYRQNTNSSLIFASTDAAGNGYVFTAPKTNISTYKSNASAKDQDQMVDLELTALLDTGNAVAGLRRLLFIDRIGTAVA